MIPLFALLFAFITYRHLHLGLVLLFLLLPTYLIRFHIGVLPSTLLEVMIWIIFAVWFIKTPIREIILNLKFKILKQPTFFAALGLFLLAATISIFTAVDMRAAAGEWKAFYVEPVVIFVILLTTLKTKAEVHNLLAAVLVGGLATAVLAIYQHYTGWLVPYDFWENRDTYRVTAWYGFPNAVGLFLAPLVPVGLYFMYDSWHSARTTLKDKTKTAKAYFITLLTKQSLLFIVVVCLLLAILYAKSTGALVGVVAGVAFLLFVYKKTRWWTTGAIIIGLAVLTLLPAQNPIKQELLFQDRSGQLRLDMWAETTQFLSNNFWTGAGLASYSERIYPYRIDTWIEVFHHPHNLFLTMWVNLGFLGIFAFVWLLVALGRIEIKKIINRQSSIINIFLLAAFIVLLTTGLVDSPYIKNDLALLFWLFPSLLLADVRGVVM